MPARRAVPGGCVGRGGPAHRRRLEPGQERFRDPHVSRLVESARSCRVHRTHEAPEPLQITHDQRMGLPQLGDEKIQPIPVVFQLEVVALEVAEPE